MTVLLPELDALRSMAIRVKLTGTSFKKSSDQEILRDPIPLAVAVKLLGGGGGPRVYTMVLK